MRTDDFKDVGTFYSNRKVVSFISLAEEQLLRKNVDFIAQNNFEEFSAEIVGVYVEDSSSLLDFVNIVKSLPSLQVPIFLGSFSFPKLLNLQVEEADTILEGFLPASQVCKAISLSVEDFIPFETEGRLIVTDYATKLPSSKDEVLIFQKVINGFKTVYPKTFDSWCSLLLKTKEFKTVNKEYLILKTLFNIK